MRGSELIDQLVSWKFPNLRSVLVAGRKRGFTAASSNTIKSEADTYRAWLFSLPTDDLLNYYKNAVKERDERAELVALREDETRFFQQHDAIADYGYWTKADYWTLDEAAILALGKDPAVVNWKKLAPFQLTSPFVKRFVRLRNLASRAQAIGKLFDPVLPLIFVTWAIDNAIDIPDAMRDPVLEAAVPPDWEDLCKKQTEAIEDLQIQLASKQAEIESMQVLFADLQARASEVPTAPEPTGKVQSPIERDNMLAVIWAMALDGYGHEPDSKRSETVREIKDAVEKLGIAISDDTIRRYLKQGEALVPELKERGA